MKSNLHETPAQRIARITAETVALRERIASGKVAIAPTTGNVVTDDMRKEVVARVTLDGLKYEARKLAGTKEKQYGKYDFICFMASKVYFTCKSAGNELTANGMSDNTVLAIAKAYGIA